MHVPVPTGPGNALPPLFSGCDHVAPKCTRRLIWGEGIARICLLEVHRVKLVPVLLVGLCSILAPLAAADDAGGASPDSPTDSAAGAPAPVAIEVGVKIGGLQAAIEIVTNHKCGNLADLCYGFFNAGLSGGCPKDVECVESPVPVGTPIGSFQPWVCVG